MLKIGKKCVSWSKNYYEILGINPSSTQQQIKEALKLKLSQAGFSLNSQANSNNKNVQDLFEAYGVLSYEKTKNQYDAQNLLLRNHLDHATLDSLKDEKYLEKYNRMKEERRKEFNVDQFNRYIGGHPNKDTIYRGRALGMPGQLRNFYEEKLQKLDDYTLDYKVTHQDADEYHVFQHSQKEVLEQPSTWHRVVIDEGFFTWRRYRLLFVVVGLMLGISLMRMTTNLYFDARFSEAFKANSEVDENGCVKSP